MMMYVKKPPFSWIIKTLLSLLIFLFLLMLPFVQKNLIQLGFNIYFWNTYRLHIKKLEGSIFEPFSIKDITFLLRESGEKIKVKSIDVDWTLQHFLKENILSSIKANHITASKHSFVNLNAHATYRKGSLSAEVIPVNALGDFLSVVYKPSGHIFLKASLKQAEIYGLPPALDNFKADIPALYKDNTLFIQKAHLSCKEGSMELTGDMTPQNHETHKEALSFYVDAKGAHGLKPFALNMKGTSQGSTLSCEAKHLIYDTYTTHGKCVVANKGNSLNVDYTWHLKKPSLTLIGTYHHQNQQHSAQGKLKNARETLHFYAKATNDEKHTTWALDGGVSLNDHNTLKVHGIWREKDVKHQNIDVSLAFKDLSDLGHLLKIKTLKGQVFCNAHYNQGKISAKGDIKDLYYAQNTLSTFNMDIKGSLPHLEGNITLENALFSGMPIDFLSIAFFPKNTGTQAIMNASMQPPEGELFLLKAYGHMDDEKLMLDRLKLQGKTFLLQQESPLTYAFKKGDLSSSTIKLNQGLVSIETRHNRLYVHMKELALAPFKDFHKAFKLKGHLNATFEKTPKGFNAQAAIQDLQTLGKLDASKSISKKVLHEKPTLNLDAACTRNDIETHWHVQCMDPYKKTFQMVSKGSVKQGSQVLKGHITASGNIHSLQALIPTFADLKGQLSLDVSLLGYTYKPKMNGKLSLKKGAFLIPMINLSFQDITANMRFNEQRVSIETLTAKDSRKQKAGTLAITGYVDIPKEGIEPDINLNGRVRRFLCVNTDFIFCEASANAKLKGMGQNAILSGTLTNENLTIDIETSPSSTIEIPFKDIHLNEKEAIKLQKRLKKEKNTPTLFSSNLKVDLNDAVYVKGMGLDSQWGGNINLTGNIVKPVILGAVELKKGILKVFDSQLSLTNGRVSFETKDEIMPFLFIDAERKVQEYQTKMSIHGPANRPKISFSSTPSFSEENVVAYMFFGKGLGQMNPAQSMQIATMIATSSQGSPGGVLGTLKDGFGLDTLELKENQNPNTQEKDPLSSHTLEVGKKLNERLYLSLNQGVGNETSKASLEFKISENITADVDMGAQKQSGVGLSWSRRY
jgi:autotransporter translocation and assembly factor TamB